MTRQIGALFAALVAACLVSAGMGGIAVAADVSAYPSSTSLAASGEEIALASELGSAYKIHLSDNFAFIFNRHEDFVRAGLDLLETTRGDFYDLYREAGFHLREAEERHVWICFSTRADFERYARQADNSPLSWLSEYYSARTNRVTLVRGQVRSAASGGRQGAGESQGVGIHANDDGLQAADYAIIRPREKFRLHASDVTRLTHEASHQFSFNSGILTRGVMYPMWVAEGLATNFEADDTGLTGRGLLNSSRRQRFVEVRWRGDLQPLSEFVGMVKPPQGGTAVSDAYAQSWALYGFLMEKHRGELMRYLDSMADKPPGRLTSAELRREFEKAFGPVRVMQQEWDEFAREMVLQD